MRTGLDLIIGNAIQVAAESFLLRATTKLQRREWFTMRFIQSVNAIAAKVIG
jgi:hypothetical protein